MVQKTVALRIDVDTRRGLLEGVPRLLAILKELGVSASFFVTMGPDRSGLAIRRAWRPSFIGKMLRTNAWRLYGLRTLLSGTLLRPQLVGAGAPELLRQIAGDGHEVAPHGYDHVTWQDRVHRLSGDRIEADLRDARESFALSVGTPPLATAAPGWRTTPRVLVLQDLLDYRYASDVRGSCAFRPVVDGVPLRTIQVPTTMPTVDELLGRAREIPSSVLAEIRTGLNVFTLHAEVEGGPLLGVFRDVLVRGQRERIEFGRVDGVVSLDGDVPLGTVGTRSIPGRSGWVACQAAPVSTGWPAPAGKAPGGC
jgi:peptidoglycan/xylan/chitin deacetylase (PgdA/CDA1 family)